MECQHNIITCSVPKYKNTTIADSIQFFHFPQRTQPRFLSLKCQKSKQR